MNARRLPRLRDPLLVQAAIAGSLSFSHLHDIARIAGQSGWKAWAYPVSVDLLMVAAWRRLRAMTDGRVTAWAWFLVALTASLGANIATAGLLHPGHVPAVLRLIVAGWPALAFFGGTLLVHRTPAPDIATETPAEIPDVPLDLEAFGPDTTAVNLPALDVHATPEPPALPPAQAPASPLPPSVPPALLDHARRVATQHQRTNGAAITPDTLRARLNVPADLATALHQHL